MPHLELERLTWKESEFVEHCTQGRKFEVNVSDYLDIPAPNRWFVRHIPSAYTFQTPVSEPLHKCIISMNSLTSAPERNLWSTLKHPRNRCDRCRQRNIKCPGGIQGQPCKRNKAQCLYTQKLPSPRCLECSRLHIHCDRNKPKCRSCLRSSRLCVWDDAQDNAGYTMNVDYCSKLTDKDFEFRIFTNYHNPVRPLKSTSSIPSRFLGSLPIRARNVRQLSQFSPIDW